MDGLEILKQVAYWAFIGVGLACAWAIATEVLRKLGVKGDLRLKPRTQKAGFLPKTKGGLVFMCILFAVTGVIIAIVVVLAIVCL